MSFLFDEDVNLGRPPSLIEQYLPDVEEHEKKFLKNIPPDPEFFSKENLSTLPGMSWLNVVETVLYSPMSDSEPDQKIELNSFIDKLKEESSSLTNEFCSTFPPSYNEKLLALDLETTGLDTRVMYDYEGNIIKNTIIVGICIATSDLKGYYLPVENTEEDGILNWNTNLILDFLKRINSEFALIFHNAQYDREVMAINGVEGLRAYPYFFDTQILSFLHDVNNKSHGLKTVSEKKISRPMIKISDLFNDFKSTGAKINNKQDVISFDLLPAINGYVYGVADAINCFGIFKYFFEHPDNPFKTQFIALEIDHKLVDTIRNLYRPGFPVNLDYFIHACKDTIHRIDLLEQSIYEEVGEKFDIGSPKQLSSILFDQFNIPILEDHKKGKSGIYSTDEDSLDKLSVLNPEYDILTLIVLYRKLQGTLSKTYIKSILNSFMDSFSPYTKIQLSFSITNVPTGRLSSSSSKGKDSISVHETKSGKLTYKYKKGSWECGMNSQGIANPRYKLAKARKINKIPVESGIEIDAPYPEHVLHELVKAAARVTT